MLALKKLCACDEENFQVRVFQIEPVSGDILRRISIKSIWNYAYRIWTTKSKVKPLQLLNYFVNLQKLPFDNNGRNTASIQVLSQLSKRSLEALNLLIQIAQGLEFIHSQGEVHR